VGILAIPANTRVYIMVLMRGFKINQKGPRMVCLYLDTKSRLTNKAIRSLYRQISFRFISKRWRFGRTMRSQVSGVEVEGKVEVTEVKVEAKVEAKVEVKVEVKV